jgi:hypothetical protein
MSEMAIFRQRFTVELGYRIAPLNLWLTPANQQVSKMDQ